MIKHLSNRGCVLDMISDKNKTKQKKAAHFFFLMDTKNQQSANAPSCALTSN